MQCPNCATQAMDRSSRQGIEIDHCPNCGGVWLDRGELEKIVSLAVSQDEQHYRRREEENDRYGDERPSGRTRTRTRESGNEDDDDDGEYEGERSRDDDDSGERGRYGRPREDDRYQDREGRPYDRTDESRERPSIWREIFENLNKLPLPRV